MTSATTENQIEIDVIEMSDGSFAYDVLINATSGSGRIGTVRLACEDEKSAAKVAKALSNVSYATFTTLPA